MVSTGAGTGTWPGRSGPRSRHAVAASPRAVICGSTASATPWARSRGWVTAAEPRSPPGKCPGGLSRAESDHHAGAARGRRVDAHRRAMLPRLLRHEREPQACAGPASRGLEPPERLEDAVAIALGDALAVVVDGQNGRRPLDQLDVHVAAGAAVV